MLDSKHALTAYLQNNTASYFIVHMQKKQNRYNLKPTENECTQCSQRWTVVLGT